VAGPEVLCLKSAADRVYEQRGSYRCGAEPISVRYPAARQPPRAAHSGFARLETTNRRDHPVAAPSHGQSSTSVPKSQRHWQGIDYIIFAFIVRNGAKQSSHPRRSLRYCKVLVLARQYRSTDEKITAINKPPSITSAQVIRDVQRHFNPSKLFQPWFEREHGKREAESHNQKQKRRSWKSRQKLQVKIGHGGTLDPMATGVLILGIGNGTKSLNQFLECTKSYETVLLFGAATDTYDSDGKVAARKPYEHITREKVEGALRGFRGKIMQRPPIFSALRVQGKRLYEYAREGKEIPVEIQERPVTVEELSITEWYDGGTHQWHWPEREAALEEKEVVDKVVHGNGAGHEQTKRNLEISEEDGTDVKRTRTEAHVEDFETEANTFSASPAEYVKSVSDPKPLGTPLSGRSVKSNTHRNSRPTTDANPTSTESSQSAMTTTSRPPCPAPAVRLRMTVTSGFYVRSLCNDLAIALGSLGIMVNLVRTRQGGFELGTNVLSYDDLAKGEAVWGPKVESMFESWNLKQSSNEEVDQASVLVVDGSKDSVSTG